MGDRIRNNAAFETYAPTIDFDSVVLEHGIDRVAFLRLQAPSTCAVEEGISDAFQLAIEVDVHHLDAASVKGYRIKVLDMDQETASYEYIQRLFLYN